MDEPWNDLYVRTDLNETSPTGRVGGLSSPDVIPVGPNPQGSSQYLTQESYGKRYTQPFYQGVPNYIFVRAKNSSASKTKSGKANLVLTNPAVVLWPGTEGWTRLKADGNYESPILRNGSSDIGPGEVGITETPFVYIPSENGHRCLVTWLDTLDHPEGNPPPTITNMSDLVRFLKDHPNYAHHNIDIAPATTKKITTTKRYTQQDAEEEMRFELSAVNCVGFGIGYSCGKPIAPDTYIVLNEVIVPSTPADKPFSVYLDFKIPPLWYGDINYYWDAKTLTPPGNDSVTFKAYLKAQPGHEVYDLCFPAEHFGFAKENEADESRFYPVGSVSAMRSPG
jgi:hypothetical protein